MKYKETLVRILAILCIVMFVGLFILGIALEVKPHISLFFAFTATLIAIIIIPNKWFIREKTK
jgi:uncharacterized membrane protein